MDSKKIMGVIPPLITPILKNEDVDVEGLRRLLNHCVEKGLHGIFVAGSYGETMGLTQENRNLCIDIAVEEVGDKIPVLCGVMDTSTRRVIENVKKLAQLGGEIAVITPVFYSQNTGQDEIIRHFEEIAKNSETDIVIYNIPQLTQSNIEPETIFRLAEIEKIIGLKDSSGNFTQFQSCVYHFENTDFCLFQGKTELSGLSLLIGADGMVPALGPLFPELFLTLYQAGVSENLEKTLYIQRLVCKTSSILNDSINPLAAAKYAISMMGMTRKQMTSPYESISKKEEQKIQHIVKQIFENDYPDANLTEKISDIIEEIQS